MNKIQKLCRCGHVEGMHYNAKGTLVVKRLPCRYVGKHIRCTCRNFKQAPVPKPLHLQTSHIYVCWKCGSTQVSIEAWVNVNTNAHVSDGASDDYYCDNCDEHITHVVSAEEFKMESTK